MGHSVGFPGRYDTKSAPQRILAAQASTEQILILSEQKLEGYSSKTIDARVVVNGRGPRRRRGRDRAFRPVVLELYSSSFFEMVLPSFFPDATTRNQPYSVFWQPKRPKYCFFLYAVCIFCCIYTVFVFILLVLRLKYIKNGITDGIIL